jgi:succinyl-CoA synthetase beta subunit
VDLFEYQAKELFAEYGVPVPKDKVANTAEEARETTTAFAADGIPQVVVKAQVKTGGRGKAGGVKLADSPADAFEKADRIIGMDIKGHTVHRVLIAEATDIKSEYYLSYLLDRANRTFLSICSVDGGMEIEELAHTNPDAIARVPVSALTGVDHEKALEIVRAGRIPAEAEEGAALVAERLWAMFADEDATLAEVNPLVLTPDGRVLALDGKVTLDDNAAFRQPDQAKFADLESTDPLEVRAKEKHLNYVKLDGEIGIIGNGAGLVMSTLDVVAYAGEPYGGVKAANFLDIGGGANADVMAAALEVINADPAVKSIFVNIFGGITRVDEVAKGIIEAMSRVQLSSPVVMRLDGTNAVEGRALLADHLSDSLIAEPTMLEAARRAVGLATA